MRLVCSTKETLALHKSNDDIWMSIHNKVYDVTTYVEDHPGGEEVLFDLAGQDASEGFEDGVPTCKLKLCTSVLQASRSDASSCTRTQWAIRTKRARR